MLRCAFARSVARWLTKPSSLESVVKGNTLSTVCIVVNSLSNEDDNYEVNLPVVEIVRLNVQFSQCSLLGKPVLAQGEDVESG